MIFLCEAHWCNNRICIIMGIVEYKEYTGKVQFNEYFTIDSKRQRSGIAAYGHFPVQNVTAI